MIKRNNSLAWAVIIFFPVFLYCKTMIGPKSGEITPRDKKVPITDFNQDTCYAEAYCEQKISCFNFDSAFFLIQKYSDSPYVLEDCLQFSLLKLVIHSDTVDLASVYKARIGETKRKYMGGFVEGSYLVSNALIQLKLIFINVRTNTYKSTSHEYLIVYDIKRKKNVSVDMRFLAD